MVAFGAIMINQDRLSRHESTQAQHEESSTGQKERHSL